MAQRVLRTTSLLRKFWAPSLLIQFCMVLEQKYLYKPRFPLCCADLPDLLLDRTSLIFELRKGNILVENMSFYIV